jgi:hypothetical protein
MQETLGSLAPLRETSNAKIISSLIKWGCSPSKSNNKLMGRLSFLFIIVGLVLVNDLFSQAGKADPIEKFWSWFKDNEKRLRKFEEDPDIYLSEILAQSRKVQDGLVIELEPSKNGVISMTVSADGNRDLFEIVKIVVARSPKVAGWQIFAFRQRVQPEKIKDLKLTVGDHDLDPGQMKFFPIVDGDSLDLIIYVKGVTDDNYIKVAYAGLLLLDNILGEYDCVMKVRSFDFHDMPAKKEELEKLQSLVDLPAYVDEFHRKKKKN